MNTKTNIKAGALTANHNQSLKVRSHVKADGIIVNY